MYIEVLHNMVRLSYSNSPLLVLFHHNNPEQSLTLAPLVDQQWWWFSVSWFDPGREEASLVCLVPQVLVQVGICDLLQGLHIIHGHQMTVQVHELDTHLQKTT